MPGYSIAALGDIMLDRTIGARFKEDPEAFRFPEIAKILEPYDIVFANLENPVALGGSPHPVQNPDVCFRAHPESLQVLENLGVCAVSVGNNHLLDYGAEALTETLDHLTARGIAWSGAGRSYAEANRPLELEVRGHKVAIFSHCFVLSASTERATKTKPGVADHKIGRLLKGIRSFRARGYDVHVSVHWGIEYVFFPISYQVRWARKMIDAGAALIIGHGPHYPQGFEEYRGGRIIYSLGNFIFDEPQKFSQRSFIYGTRIEPSGLAGNEIYPVHAVDGLPRVVHGRDRQRLIGLLDALSRRYRKMTRKEWQKVNNIWFQDMVWRTLTMRSFKFFRLPPPSFFLRLGLKNYLRKARTFSSFFESNHSNRTMKT